MRGDQIDIKRRMRQNIALRIIAKPYFDLISKVLKHQYHNSKEPSRILKLKNSNLGRRCFIVGNGPSLTIDDLNKLKNETTFASNYIDQLFTRTDWRPTYYLCFDKFVIGDKGILLGDIQSEYKILDIRAKKYIDENDNIFYLYMYDPFYANTQSVEKPFFSDRVDQQVYGGKTVTFVAIQLAAYMGFKEIYLIGVDNSYGKYVDGSGKVVLDSNKSSYAKGIEKRGNGIPYVDAMQESYMVAKSYCDENNIHVFNSTRGGALEVFPRVNFDDVILNKS